MRKTFSQYVMGLIMVSSLSACAPNAAYNWQVSLAPYSGENFLDNWAADSLPFDELRTVPDGYIDIGPAYAYPFLMLIIPKDLKSGLTLESTFTMIPNSAKWQFMRPCSRQRLNARRA